MKEYTTACPRNCYSTCGLKVWVDNNKIKKIEPLPDNLATPEGVCVKGQSYVERANSKDRILYPLKKHSNSFIRITWGEALNEISEKLTHYKENFGAQSVMFYAASGMSGLLNSFSLKFWKLFGGATITYGNLCWPAGLEAVRLTLGENKHNIPWDLEEAKLIILWGKNPAETNIQQMIPINKAQEKGAKVIVIDPRRTPSAEQADILIQPLPGTDAALALGVANILINKECIDKDFIDKNVLGFLEFKNYVKKFTPEKASEISSVPITYINKIAELIHNAKTMTIVPGYGMQRFSNGGQTIRALLALQVITGNIGKSGSNFHYANLQSYIFDDIKEPLNYYPPKNQNGLFRKTISMAKLGEDILSQKDPELKMAWVERGNPISQNPNTNINIKAFRKLEFKVVVDQFMTDTAIEADIILPAKNMFEQSDIIGSYWNPYVQLKQKVVEPAGEVKPETDIYWELGHKLGFSKIDIERDLLKPGDESVNNFLQKKLDKFSLKLDKLAQKPIIPTSNEDIVFNDFKFNTPSGKIEILSKSAKDLWSVNELPTYEPIKTLFDDEQKKRYPFILMSPNTKNRIHSQFGNLKVIKQFDSEPYMLIHPADAKEYQIGNNTLVKVHNELGHIKLKTRFDYSLKRKCVCIYNGWWEQEGCSVNKLTQHLETDMGHGTAFHDNRVQIENII